MSAKKRTLEDTSAASGTLPGRRWLVVTTSILLAGGGATYAIWNQVRDHVLAGAEYQLEPQKIIVSPPPAWIRSDVRAEVLRQANFDGKLSLVDPELTVRLASVFATHPWVAHVERVSKRFPAGVEVVLSYRKPVAMVQVRGGALPVDVEGVVLPSGDFTSEEAEHYPRIDEIHTAPGGEVGARWSDVAVVGAAQIAAVLAADWQSLGLARIVPAGRKPARSGYEYEYALFTSAGTRIDWGRAPGTDSPGETAAADKVARLRDYIARHGSLDGSEGPQRLRFLDTGHLAAERRAPVKALPKAER
jgi:hypothetical protein